MIQPLNPTMHHGGVKKYSHIMKIKIKGTKGEIITGDYLEKDESNTVIVFLSGLTGGRTSRLVSDSSLFFFKNGFSTFSFDFFNPTSKSVLQLNFSIYDYLGILKGIINFFNNKYSRIVLVGHSFGAVISILFLNKYRSCLNMEIILWDPSILSQITNWISGYFKYDTNKRLYYGIGGGKRIIANDIFYSSLLDFKDSTYILELLNPKTCIIGAEKGASENAKQYFSKLHGKNKTSSYFSIIKRAGHLFGSKIAQKELFKKTLYFLNKNTK